jgi:hypothetical protein
MSDFRNTHSLSAEQKSARVRGGKGAGQFGKTPDKRRAESSVADVFTWDELRPEDTPRSQPKVSHSPEKEKLADVAALEQGKEPYLASRGWFTNLGQGAITEMYVRARRELASREDTDVEAYEQFYNLRYGIASHPEAAPAVLDRLIDDHIELDPGHESSTRLGLFVMTKVTEHPNSTVAMMDRLKWMSPDSYVAGKAEEARILKPEYRPTLTERFEQTKFMDDTFMGLGADTRMFFGRPWTRLAAKIRQVAGRARSLNRC